MQKKYLFTFFIIAIFVFSSCNNQAKLVYYIQNTHEYWDTVSVCVYLSGDSNNRYADDCSSLADKDSLLWEVLVFKSKDDVFVKKEINLPKVKNNKSKNIVEIIKFRNNVVSSGSFDYKNKVQYNITTIKNSGVAFNIESLITKDAPNMKEKLIQEY